MKRLFSLISIIACFLMATPSFAGSDNKPIRLRMATQYMNRHPVYRFVWKDWIKEIQKRTKGRVIITFYNPNTICPSAELLDAVINGQVDIADHYLTRNPGRFPLGTVTGKIPSPTTTVLAASMAFWELWKSTPAIQDEFKGLKILGLHATAATQLSTKQDKPVRTLDDIKGLRLACAGKDSISIATTLGASTVMQPGPELYMALSRNMAEGVIYPIPPMRSFKVNEATKYTTLFDFVSTPCWMAMNQAKWDSLPPEVKKVFEETTGEVMSQAIGKALDRGVTEDTVMMKKEGQEFIIPAPEVKALLIKTLTPSLKKVWLDDLARAKSNYPDPDGLYKKACELTKKNEALYGRK